MVNLKPDECRVLGVLVEKAQTTPQQYPLTLNALTLGCNQKNNRFPVVNWDEERVLNALDSLRAKGIVREALLSGSRVAKFRHLGREALQVETPALVILAELMLRGPQSPGDLRARASRMHPLESLEAVEAVLKELMSRPEPLVRELPSGGGFRAKRYVQLVCPDLHRLDLPEDAEEEDGGHAPAPRAADPGLVGRIAALEGEVQALRGALMRLATGLGVDDPFSGS